MSLRRRGIHSITYWRKRKVVVNLCNRLDAIAIGAVAGIGAVRQVRCSDLNHWIIQNVRNERSLSWLKTERTTIVPKRIPDALDLSSDAHRASDRVLCPGRPRRAQPIIRRNDFNSHRHRAHRDDVSTAGQGSLRGVGGGLSGYQGLRPSACV
jgi:hypothetical protein